MILYIVIYKMIIIIIQCFLNVHFVQGMLLISLPC